MRYTVKSLAAVVTVAVGTAMCCVPANAQFGSRPNNGGPDKGNPGPMTTPAGALLDLPKGITRIISIDAQNTLLVEVTDPDDPTNHQYLLIPVQHVYSGGIAKVLGGSTMPTAPFLSPATQGGAGAGTGNRAQTNSAGSPAGGTVSQFTPGSASNVSSASNSGTTAPLGLPPGIGQIISSMQFSPQSTTLK